MRVDADGVLALLRSLPAEVVSKRGGPVKLALAKGARLIRDEAKKNFRASVAVNGEDSTGATEKAIIASRGKAPTGSKGERYLVRVKKGTFVNAKGEKTSTLMTANLMEYGSSHQPALPWLRPAVQAKGQQAVTVIVADLRRRIDLTVKKLARQNKAR
ncbi:hypothetical protein [Lysobacter sp. F6437]|uniref:hypothetical protein n=1 Tax=Lysobacter sp. F6437 TaxID=3459296 RepID=UPI00403DC7EE